MIRLEQAMSEPARRSDPRIDAYIRNAAEFAQPILRHLRELVHRGCPAIVETTKWSMPHFEYKGILCNMAAFKAHCAFGFWRGRLLFKNNPALKKKADEAMGHFGRLTSVDDLPPDKVLLGFIHEAMRLNEAGIKPAPRPKAVKKELIVPKYFAAALKKNRKAQSTFNAFSYSQKKEYVEWVSQAKTEETRERRLKTSIEWMADGKTRHWKHARKS